MEPHDGSKKSRIPIVGFALMACQALLAIGVAYGGTSSTHWIWWGLMSLFSFSVAIIYLRAQGHDPDQPTQASGNHGKRPENGHSRAA